jgi:hypothetical protein
MNKLLDEQLSYIYLSEDLSDFISSIRNKFRSIISAFKSQNVKTVASSLKNVPTVDNADQIVMMGRRRLRNFDRYYKEGNKHTHGNHSDTQKILSSVYATMKVAQEHTNNRQARMAFDDKIQSFVEWLDEVPEGTLAGGVSFVIISNILGQFISSKDTFVEIILNVAQTGGFIASAIGIFLMIIKYILLFYLKLKGIEVDRT